MSTTNRVSSRRVATRRLINLLLHAFPLFLAVAVYSYSVTLPFFLDDGPHFAILRQSDGLRHWGDFPSFPFYRPFTFSLWKSFEIVAGEYEPRVLHLLNVLCFGLAGVLTGQLVRRTAPVSIRRTAGVLAGCGFVLFPFSYQAVAMVAALFHLILALGALLCLWSALLWLEGRGGWLMLVLCWFAAFAAVFSHENGVLILPLLVGLIVTVFRGHWPERQRLALVVVPVALIVTAYVLLWLAFRPQSDTSLNPAFDVALAMLLQGLVYPVAALVRPLAEGDVGASVLLLMLAGVIVSLFLIAWRRMPSIAPLMFYGLGWYVLAVTPAALLLSAGYVLGQPRLALFASIGGSIFWGVVLAAIFRHMNWALVLPVVLAAYISLEFLGMRRAVFLHLRDFNREALRLFEAQNVAERGALLVNAPDYIRPDESDRRFLLGTEGVLFVDDTLNYNQQFWLNSDTDYHNVEVVAYPEIQRNQGFGFQAHPPLLDRAEMAQRARDAPLVYVTQFDGREFYPVLVGGTALEGENDPLVHYPEVDFALTDAQAIYDENETRVEVRLRWQAGDPSALKVFVHVDCEGDLVGQSDGYPWGDTYPFAAWRSGETQTDIRQIRLEAAVTPGCLRVYTGLYREVDVTRLEAIDVDTDERLPDDRYSVPFADS